MNVLHVIPGDLWGGAESQVYYTLQEMVKNKNYRIRVILFNKGILFRKLSQNDISVTVLDENRMNSLKLIFAIKREVEKFQPTIIHVHEYKSHVLTVLAVLFKKNIKMIRTIHGQTGVPLKIKYFKTHLVFLIEKIFIRLLTTRVIAVSMDLEKKFKKEYGASKIKRIYNSVINLEPMVNPSKIRRNFNLTDSTFWIATAARLVPVKNIELLIAVARTLKKQGEIPDFKISVFGDGPLKTILQDQIEKFEVGDVFELHGFYEQIYEIYSAIDVFVLSSYHEGMPMSLLEAMSFGVIPVCTNVGGMKEIIKNGMNGYLTESNNAQNMAAILNQIYVNRQNHRKLGENAQAYIKNNFSIESGVQKLENLYLEVTE